MMEDRFNKVFALIERQVSLQIFEKYVLSSSEYKQQLFATIRQCNTSGFPRFNIWRILLEVIPIDSDWPQKKQSLQISRNRWLLLKEEAKTGVKVTSLKDSAPPVPKNPLMKAMMVNTEKKEVDSDSFLLQQIKKDVDRTYQEMNFFQDTNILKLLTSVLFIWCKINADVSYKQGINELLASIVFVYFQEAVPQDFQASNEIEEKYLFLNNVAHAQADIYAIFEKIMEIQKQMFKQSLDSNVKGLVNPNSKNSSPILQRIIQIQDQKLKMLDLELFRILKLQDVKTKTFLLRWIRCLHTRQFGLIDSLQIWDSIFLDAFESSTSKVRHQYEFVDAVCIAMFIYMRSIVLTRQTANQILQIYQKYPPLSGQYIKQLIALSWSVCVELRASSTNTTTTTQNNANFNQLEQPVKINDPTITQGGAYAANIKKHEIQHKKKQKKQTQQSIIKETQQIQKQANAIFNKKTPVKNDHLQLDKNDGNLFRKSKGIKFQTKSKEKIVENKKIETSPVKQEVKQDKNYVFTGDQLREVIDLLKKSISLNQDIESRALASSTLKLLESKMAKLHVYIYAQK